MDFPGALVMVTHDRYLLDRISTAVLGLDGRGGARIYADYWQWEQDQLAQKQPRPEKPAAPAKAAPAAAAKRKLSYLEQREWEQMEARILEEESEAAAIREEMQSPEAVSDGPRLAACYEKLQASEARIEALYARWAELEASLT